MNTILLLAGYGILAFFLYVLLKVTLVYRTKRPTKRTSLPITTKFKLGSSITPEQEAFFDVYGFLHFERVAAKEEVNMITSEMNKIEQQWLQEKRTQVYGIPLFWGKYNGNPIVQRFAFSSMFSEKIRAFVRDDRFEPIRKMVGINARVGHDEKDGVVINRYINIPGSAYPKLGWHTDGLRDLFYGRMPVRMFNVGLHLDNCTADNGGLRLIPGTHLQGFWSMCFYKWYFVSHGVDANEVTVETSAGDLTVHDGRLWHRVAQSTRIGDASLRRSMYVPYLTGPYEPKSDNSKTPFYHKLGSLVRRIVVPVDLHAEPSKRN